MATPHLLGLPLELRHMIYKDLFPEPDGYHYDSARGKLRKKDGRKINLALMFTCKQAVQEVLAYTLMINEIHFSVSSAPSVSERDSACMFDGLQRNMIDAKMEAIREAYDLRMPLCGNPDVEARIKSKHPQFHDIPLSLSKLSLSGVDVSGVEPESLPRNEAIFRSLNGEAKSGFWNYLDSVLRALSEDTGFIEELSHEKCLCECGKLYHGCRSSDVLDCRCYFHPHTIHIFEGNRYRSFYKSPLFLQSPQPWHIPSHEELMNLGMLVGFVRAGDPNYNKQVEKWRFSAAARAIRFLKRLPPTTRCYIRKIFLYEEFGVLNSDESHAMGFVPFCAENPHLKIERRVNIWRNLLCLTARRRMKNFLDPRRVSEKSLRAFIGVSVGRFASWILEASALTAAGMPHDSFKLIFDAGSQHSRGTKMFEFVKLAAVWQAAWLQESARRRVSHGWMARKASILHVGEGFPQAVNDIVEGRSLVSCTFPVGGLLPTWPVIQLCRSLELNDWVQELTNELGRLRATLD